MTEDLFIHPEDREILRDLFSADTWIDVSAFHEKYLLSPGQIARVIRKYLELDIVIMEGFKLSLTEYGKAWVLKNRRSLFSASRGKPWSIIPNEFIFTEINKDQYYLPNYGELMYFIARKR